MCTLSIWREPDGTGYRLWFNRDEKLARAPESGPRAEETREGVRFAAPRDGERGGTWLVLNERGVTVCVLNDYEAGGAGAGRRSRGELPLVAAGAEDAEAAVAAVMAVMAPAGEPGDFSPFKLVAVDAGGRARALHWDGRRLTEWVAVEFVTSSSFASAEVRRAREGGHAAMVLSAQGRDAPALERWHWAHDAAAGAWSVRMRRSDACTRSVCVVRVRAAGAAVEAGLRYTTVDWSRADGLGGGVEVVL